MQLYHNSQYGYIIINNRGQYNCGLEKKEIKKHNNKYCTELDKNLQ